MNLKIHVSNDAFKKGIEQLVPLEHVKEICNGDGMEVEGCIRVELIDGTNLETYEPLTFQS